MKRLSYVLAVVLPAALMFSMVDASAQRKNSTSHDVKTIERSNETAAPMVQNNVQMMKKDGKMMNCNCGKDSKMSDCNCKKAKMMDCGCNKDKECMGSCMKQKKGHWIEKKTNDINEDYNEALEKINKSKLEKSQKDLLVRQAQENRDLAVKQVRERAELRQTHMKARMNANMQDMMGEKANRKAVKKVMDID